MIICDICNKSPGIDELPISVFKVYYYILLNIFKVDIFGMAVVDIVIKSLDQGIFPSELKMVKIGPIYKYREIENYLPISLLPVFSKILEKNSRSANRKLSNK